MIEGSIISDIRVYNTLQHLAREAENLNGVDPKKAVLCRAISSEIVSGNYDPAIEYLKKRISSIRWGIFWSAPRPFGDPIVNVIAHIKTKESESEIGNLEVLINGLTESSTSFSSDNKRPSLRDLKRSLSFKY